MTPDFGTQLSNMKPSKQESVIWFGRERITILVLTAVNKWHISFKFRISYTRIVIFASKYVQLNNIFISYPCVTFIHYYSYLFVVYF
jgi:hypothetical protein